MKQYASDKSTAHYCWLPLIGLHTGARINEICQLNPMVDIAQDANSGIHYFHFTNDSESAFGGDKSIKNKSSKRVVPIHSKLIQMGFLDYVQRMRNQESKILFPAWQPRNGKASANATKWFVRYIQSIGLRDDTDGARLGGFHAFRHCFVTVLNINLDTKTPTGQLMLSMLAAIAQFERELMLERQREDVAIAQREGKYKGRKPVDVDKINQVKSLVECGLSIIKAVKEVGISRQTYCNAIEVK